MEKEKVFIIMRILFLISYRYCLLLRIEIFINYFQKLLIENLLAITASMIFSYLMKMFQLLLTYFKIIQYQIIYYFLGAVAILDDLQNRDYNKIGKHDK